MTALGDVQLSALAETLGDRIAAHAPGWTRSDVHDPGVALLEVCVFLAETLSARGTAVAEGGQDLIARVVRALDTLDRSASPKHGRETPGDSSPRRVRYFTGQLLSAEDLQAEQDYHREKDRRQLRELHGCGVVRGLELAVEGGTLRIQPGVAVDPRGELLVVAAPGAERVPAGAACWFVGLAYAECESDPVPVPGSDTVENSRIREGFRITFDRSSAADAVALGRLLCGADGWSLDPDFAPPRAR